MLEEETLSFMKSLSWWSAAVLSFLSLSEAIRFFVFDSPINGAYVIGMAIVSIISYVFAYRFVKKGFEPIAYKRLLGEVLPLTFAVQLAFIVIAIMVIVIFMAIFM